MLEAVFTFIIYIKQLFGKNIYTKRLLSEVQSLFLWSVYRKVQQSSVSRKRKVSVFTLNFEVWTKQQETCAAPTRYVSVNIYI